MYAAQSTLCAVSAGSKQAGGEGEGDLPTWRPLATAAGGWNLIDAGRRAKVLRLRGAADNPFKGPADHLH